MIDQVSFAPRNQQMSRVNQSALPLVKMAYAKPVDKLDIRFGGSDPLNGIFFNNTKHTDERAYPFLRAMAKDPAALADLEYRSVGPQTVIAGKVDGKRYELTLPIDYMALHRITDGENTYRFLPYSREDKNKLMDLFVGAIEQHFGLGPELDASPLLQDLKSSTENGDVTWKKASKGSTIIKDASIPGIPTIKIEVGEVLKGSDTKTGTTYDLVSCPIFKDASFVQGGGKEKDGDMAYLVITRKEQPPFSIALDLGAEKEAEGYQQLRDTDRVRAAINSH